MKNQLLFPWLCLLGLLQTATAQIQTATVEVNPHPFGENDTVTLTFSDIDLSQWGVNDAYLWAWSYNNAGVQQDAPNNGSWDNSNEAHKLQEVNGKLSISFKVSEFFGRTGITRIGFLVKAKDGTGDKKTQDFIEDVGTFELTINNPTSGFTLLENGNTLSISATSSVNALFELYVDGTLVNSTNTPSLNYSYSLTISDYSEITLKALDGDDVQSNVFYAAPKADVPAAPVPAGLKDGINYDPANPGRATFVFHAPGKQVVHWIGSLNNWEISNDYLMNYDSASERFWIELSGLQANSDILYQYKVDYSLAVADPYSHLIIDPWNDQYIDDNTFAGIPSYPTGKTSNAITWFQTKTTTYNWGDSGYEKPAKEDLVIYELLLRDFDEDHSYQALIARLDYLETLGVNAIELMPVNEFDGNESWGYNPSFHMATDKYYGSPEMLKKLIDESHQRGIAVIADIVFNHATGQNPYFRMYNTSNGDTGGSPSSDNPFFNQSAKHAYSVFYDFNHQYQGTQDYVKRIVQYWIEEFKFDGFRWDLTKGFTQNCTSNDEGCTGSYQADRVELLKKYADFQWAVDDDSYVIFEHLGGNNEESEWANYRLDEGKGIMLWSNLNGPYSEAAMGYNDNRKSDFEWASYKNRGWEEPRNVVYMESHDEERLMFRALEYGNSSGSYSTKTLGTALDRMGLDAAFFFTIPGPKMIWQFGELGYDFSIDYNGRIGNKPIRWDYFNDPDRKDLYETYSKLIALRNSEVIFDTDDFTINAGNSNGIKTIHLNTSAPGNISNMLIVGNFGVTSKSVQVEFQKTGVWYDLFNNNKKKTISETTTTLTLQPGEWHIYADQPSELFPNDNFPDADEDGVPDSDDNCPETPLGDTVNLEGCTVFTLPADAFSVKSVGSSCNGENNGKIEISTSVQDHTYLVSMNGEDPIKLNTGNGHSASFLDLAPGIYNICIKVEGRDDFERCYEIQITEPETFTTSTVVNQARNQVTLKLDGAETYYINLNEKFYVTTESEFQLDLESGSNRISVSTDLDCQGSYFEEIFVSEEVAYYPNPTKGYLQVYVSGTDSKVKVEIFGSTGNLLSQKSMEVFENRVIKLDINYRSSGLYMVRIKGETVDKTFKVIKE
ncbi:alpha-amylase family glycosyl hydrolase [Christiangramia sabulilitoris]|uniref:T9SS type A sorting domain-containing protein n=1 Tax=Christiangramia sabulilitoris TaxID=2583991 RepID=A0A550I2N2_9FLAO|nr:alpha-amylase family glycosyl hydrolase [Christiangramia sabulilitoris]TRO65209.1 T9SS type A sorting domain-containing protein [Christiangramia sabulilitoris]